MNAEITPLILTYNEASNIRRALEKLHWAKRIVVLDSFSTDETQNICRNFSNVEFLQRKFDDHTSQWNFGLTQIKSEWVLTLDADYILTPELLAELERWKPTPEINAWFISFKYCIRGRRLRASLYPPRAVLFRKRQCGYIQDGHTQKLQIEGQSASLKNFMDHDDRKPLSHWLQSQDRYAVLESKKLLNAVSASLPMQDRMRKFILPAPFVVFFYTLLGKGMLFEGWPGWYYVLQRTIAEMILSLRLIEARLDHD